MHCLRNEFGAHLKPKFLSFRLIPPNWKNLASETLASLGIMGGELSTPLEPANTTVVCDVRGVSEGPSIGPDN